MTGPETATEEVKKIWVSLAELFFLDDEPGDKDFDAMAERLQKAGWDRTRTRKTLIEYIAPHVAGNLGYLIIPVIGQWGLFHDEPLCTQIAHSIALRAQKPQWHFYLSDKIHAWMLGHLGMQRLLMRLSS